MKILIIIQSLADWFDRKRTICGFFLVVFVLYALPALANPEATPSRSGSVLNILLLGCIAYFLVRAFRRRSGGNEKPRPNNWNTPSTDDKSEETQKHVRPVAKPVDRHEAARQAWSVLSSDTPAPKPTLVRPVEARSDGFNEAEFLEGAKLFFTRFQQAKDAHELQEIRGFLSDDVYNDAVAETQRNPAQGAIEISHLNARLMDMKTESKQTSTTVFYDVQMRRGTVGELVHFRVVWEFSRDDTIPNALWVLEKINKVDQ